jgi:hypothetical protein
MEKIVYTDPLSGNVVVVHPAPEWLSAEGNTVELCAQKSVPEGVTWRIINENDIPQDRTFRNAWTDEFDTPTVDINLDKAKAIHLEKLRLERNELLSKEDKNYMISLERGLVEEAKEIAERKQQLRDMPVVAKEEMNNINSAEELKQYYPDILKEGVE